MADSAVAQAVRAQKDALLAKDASVMRELARYWMDVERALADKITLLAEQIAESKAASKAVAIGKEWQLERLRSLLEQAQIETAKYTGVAAETVARAQTDLLAIGVQDAQSVLTGAVGGRFDKLSTLAVEAMIAQTAGVAGDAPLRTLLFERMVRDTQGNVMPGVQERLVRTIRQAIVQGWNPKKTAKLMKNDLAEGLNKALVIARTETMRAYRMGSTEQYRQSGVVAQQVRMCAHTPSTCAACLADEGNPYPIDEPIPDHPNGRCTGVPWIEGMPKPGFETGEKWFGKQDEGTQRDILGPKRFDLWKEGKVKFSDFATRTDHATWGGGLGVTPIPALGGES